ncbi:MAG: DUF4352 domain-containing protein [Lachnospiraceae bacterium]|nr:DUF4352 domain-containing protein [Lachnospiraceae bacterium]
MIKKITSLFAGAVAALLLTACGSVDKETVIYANDKGFAEGQMGDTLRSSFFDYRVDSACLCGEFEGYTAADGYELLVAEITVHNIFDEGITMYDTDFQVQWNSDAEDARDWPVTFYLQEGESLGRDVLPNQYDLEKAESRTGLLVYEVPEGETEFSIVYQEYFEDESYGDIFFVNFSAEHKQAP